MNSFGFFLKFGRTVTGNESGAKNSHKYDDV